MAIENLALEADHGATGLCGAAQRPDQLRRWHAAGGVGGKIWLWINTYTYK